MYRATKVSGYLRAMGRRGISSRSLLAGSRIDAGRLTDPAYRVSLDQYEAVVMNMIRLTETPGIAFSLADIYINFGDLGLLGYAMLSAKTLHEALQVRIEYKDAFDMSLVDFASYEAVSTGYVVTVSTPPNASTLQRFETEELLVTATMRAGYLTDTKPVLESASFSYPAPPYLALYEALCKCPLQFEASRTTLRFREPRLDTPIKTRNDELFEICAAHCRQVMRSGPKDNHLQDRIRRIFLAAPAKLPSLEEVSGLLGLSTSTFRRQLDANGQHYQEIKDTFRLDLAREYLSTGHMSSKQIAHLLGFSSPSNFSRAFREWSGQTAGRFRKSSELAGKRRRKTRAGD